MKCYGLPISRLRDMYNFGQINLEPPYQRKPAWKTQQRQLLLSSLFNGIPIPAIIFHRHFDAKRNKDIHDVLDGKQRIETIFHFIELIEIKDEKELWVEFVDPHTNKKDYLSYNGLKLKKVNKKYENILEKFWNYELPVIEYGGDLNDFFGRNVASMEVFVRINSTGSPLKKHEVRHAKYSGPFFELGDKLERKYTKLFKSWRIVSNTDVARYTLHEFILELCTAINISNYSDRRKELDRMLSQIKWNTKEATKIERKFNKVISWIKDIFPQYSIQYTRFKNKTDFYSLFVVLYKLISKGYVTLDKKGNRCLGGFLLEFSEQIQELDLKIKPFTLSKEKLSRSENRLLPYVVSTRQATDTLKHREIRDTYLMSALKDGFILKSKDSKRIFDSNVKDLLWSKLIRKTKKPKCPDPTGNCKCKKYLTFEDAQIDHKLAWSKSGKTDLKNAQLLCSSCNSSKGNK